MERWRAVACTAMSAIVAFALVGAAPLAFAEGEDVTAEDDLEVPGNAGGSEAADEEGGESIESALRLGSVELSCVPQCEDDGNAGELAMGVPVERTYVITNEGELAYVRLASSLAFGALVHANELGVTETAAESPDVQDEEADEDSDGESALPTWHLAEDGWWYRSEPLAAGESIEVSVVADIPFTDEWVRALKTGSTSRVEENVHIEAVQVRNTVIDLGAARPWGDLEVEALPGDKAVLA